MTTWMQCFWDEEAIWFYFEVDAEGWVIRQVELQGLPGPRQVLKRSRGGQVAQMIAGIPHGAEGQLVVVGENRVGELGNVFAGGFNEERDRVGRGSGVHRAQQVTDVLQGRAMPSSIRRARAGTTVTVRPASAMWSARASSRCSGSVSGCRRGEGGSYRLLRYREPLAEQEQCHVVGTLAAAGMTGAAEDEVEALEERLPHRRQLAGQ
ncbi:hypothetical protein ABZ766_33440 [Streptomyces sp. NPDC006670]|uniref:hypothetical protein n=1 Tax=Streptomyces sp. NPDC006670 TaxID=3154476 RepID=UPI0033E1D2EE